MKHIVLISFLASAVWLIRRDTASRPGISSALWIPTLWLAIIASRPLSAWLGIGASGELLEGNPINTTFFLTCIILSLIVLSRRQLATQQFLRNCWPLILFYAFLLFSTTWANDPILSLKRWLKEFGNILIALVILTEANPLHAFRAVFIRSAILLFPLSYIFIRWFPELGRFYSPFGGDMQATGVTFQKNSLGALIMVCGIALAWELIELYGPDRARAHWITKYLTIALAALGAWLLILCDSKTSIVALTVGSLLVCSIRLPFFRRKVAAFGTYAIAGVVAFYFLDRQLGVSAFLIESLGRDMSFTGRTEIWPILLKAAADPVFGTGFMAFWDNREITADFPEWIGYSAHNGYLEIYLMGGLLGTTALIVMLWGTMARINRALAEGSPYSVVRFAILVMALIGNFSESHFAYMSPLGLLFILAAIGTVPRQIASDHSHNTTDTVADMHSNIASPSHLSGSATLK